MGRRGIADCCDSTDDAGSTSYRSVDVDFTAYRESCDSCALCRISETLQKVIQDLGFDGVMVPGPIRELRDLLSPGFPIIIQRAVFRHGGRVM
jgi:hypothetical protein